MGERPQDRGDLLRLIAKIEGIEAQVRLSDAAKAAACRELLAKLAPHAAPRFGGTLAGASPPAGTARVTTSVPVTAAGKIWGGRHEIPLRWSSAK